MVLRITTILLSLIALLPFRLETAESPNSETGFESLSLELYPTEVVTDSIEVLVGTFLGNEKRNYYGNWVDTALHVLWKTKLGGGKTIVSARKGAVTWNGAGWTGQPLVMKENGSTYLIQGCFDHTLKKIDARTGEVVWEYRYDDILKGTGTVWVNNDTIDPENRIVILQGSRLGYGKSLRSKEVFSFRAVSYITGQEIWRMNVDQGASYSRDVDASALVLNDTAYIGLENGLFTVFDPYLTGTVFSDTGSMELPQVYQQLKLYTDDDRRRHGRNLVTEASPVRIGDHVYIAAGSGHVYGYNLKTKAIDWDFYVGSDINGTTVVTEDECLLVSIEKQYIKGRGGVLKIDPRKDARECVVWFQPTGDRKYADWRGGVIGSPSVNDHYNVGLYPRLAAFTGIDGYLYVVRHDSQSSRSRVHGPDSIRTYPMPILVLKEYVGPSISTPVFVKNRLVVAGYTGIRIYEFDYEGNFKLLAQRKGGFESTPVAYDGRVYIASRNGYLYCLGVR